ncbi:MAG: S-methyl-5-thioribose-1-phosphate isomerase [Gammaproteobacteria bacterium]|nr:MAG: S-methyl-5-thioribose-1-phosphate isomerase [Gammaproteobacteria bacterium]
MKVDGAHTRTIWLNGDGWSVEVIDQTRLPHRFVSLRLVSVEDATRAIADMIVRGAPLIGAAAAYGLALAMRDNPGDGNLADSARMLLATRPTAVNLRWVVDRLHGVLEQTPVKERCEVAYSEAARICDEDVAINHAIGEHGLALIEEHRRSKSSGPINILTHCNAGWLATVDWGTALAPVYMAHDAGIDVHVWVNETRPRNQGSRLTAWELGRHDVPHTVVVDNVAGHLMQRGKVDLCITGTDRTTASGDVCNKIGTYLNALAARDNDVPFYVGLPGPSIDWTMDDGIAEIPIEERDPHEITTLSGLSSSGEVVSIQLTADACPVANFAFDVTPARLITGLITERGVCPATSAGLRSLYPNGGGDQGSSG